MTFICLSVFDTLQYGSEQCIHIFWERASARASRVERVERERGIIVRHGLPHPRQLLAFEKGFKRSDCSSLFQQKTRRAHPRTLTSWKRERKRPEHITSHAHTQSKANDCSLLTLPAGDFVHPLTPRQPRSAPPSPNRLWASSVNFAYAKRSSKLMSYQ